MPYDIALREEFDQGPGQPELYDKARPRYPDALFDALVEKTSLTADAKLLEIGPGPGIATEPLAEQGYAITAIERSAEMTEAARSNLTRYPRVNIVTKDFEDVKLPAGNFDLVYAANAFNCVDPEVRFQKAHELLKSAGHIAIIHTNYLSDGRGDAFYRASQPIYDDYAPGTNVNWVNMTAEPQDDLPSRDDIQPFELDSDLFESDPKELFGVFSKYKGFSTREYVDLLGTFSTNLALPANKRRYFLAEMARLIDTRFGGHISWRFGMSLTIGRKILATAERL